MTGETSLELQKCHLKITFHIQLQTRYSKGLVRKLRMIDGPWPLAPWVLTTQLWKHTQMFILKPLKDSSHSIITLALCLLYRTQHQHKMKRIDNYVPFHRRTKYFQSYDWFKGCSEQMNLQSYTLEKADVMSCGFGSIQSEKIFWKLLWGGGSNPG